MRPVRLTWRSAPVRASSGGILQLPARSRAVLITKSRGNRSNHDIKAIQTCCGSRGYLRKAETNAFGIEAIDVEGSVLFPGFDEIHVTRGKLTDMYADPARYEPWHVAMAAVQAVYVIACTVCGMLYVGSATGAENLWQRWGDYASSPDGSAGDTGIVRHISEHPEHLASFRYSVLQTFAPGADPELVRYAERRFKTCLDSVDHGMNDNH